VGTDSEGKAGGGGGGGLLLGGVEDMGEEEEEEDEGVLDTYGSADCLHWACERSHELIRNWCLHLGLMANKCESTTRVAYHV